MKSVKIVLENDEHELDFDIEVQDNQLGNDWYKALQEVLQQRDTKLIKHFCFLGFPNGPRDLSRMCKELNHAVRTINNYNKEWVYKYKLQPYVIEDLYTPNGVRFPDDYPVGKGKDFETLGLRLKHDVLNRLHNHFERLEGTVDEPSLYGQCATPEVRAAIGKLNTLCHEIESRVLSERKAVLDPFWVRPSQVHSFAPTARRYPLTDEHRQGFVENGYDRELGGVYMHWCQIGKTVHEVFRDEGPVKIQPLPNGDWILDGTCEAVTGLKFYSGEFDIEWGNSITHTEHKFHRDDVHALYDWLLQYCPNLDSKHHSLGYLKIGQVNIKKAFDTENAETIWKRLGSIGNVHRIEAGPYALTFPYRSDEEWLK